ncbi:MAG: flagellar motor switch protein FliN [Rhodospirillaceae bacterium]|jgi:flagellar motor switch protein FliN|nr:flagellar motor switch protein FliN [Rhodospirillaceae bacterium]MBT4486581.1 flagellar motor switch protein FliN [Rhodospirillaceae bacterium]MBT5193351.1 flagellar motor switch protein FliN [Rhodospirillaceae bacterium]MBT5896826.1 flagellar motor switch protein FliN [Rhodospirillaceae bacterium]
MNDQRLADVDLEISVVIGSTEMPIHQLLRMGRGAVIELDATTEDYVWILANNKLIARGEIMVNGENVAVQVTETIDIEDE